jgi:hypothetical protein
MRWIGWLLWGVELAGVVVVVVLAPIASVYAFVTGEPGSGPGLATPPRPDCLVRA